MAASYVLLDGVGDYISTPDAAAFSALSDYSHLALIAADDWTPTAVQFIAAHSDGGANQRSWTWAVNTAGTLREQLATVGTAFASTGTSSVAPTIADGSALWLLAIRDKAAGTIKVYTSPFVANSVALPAIGSFTQLGTTASGLSTGTLFNSTAALTVGSNADSSATNALKGKVYRFALYTGQYGSGSETLVRDCNANDYSSGSTWVSATTGETWTLQGNAVVRPSRDASDTLLGSDTATRSAFTPARTVADALLGADTATRLVAVARTASDALLGADSATAVVARPRTTSDALLGTDAATRQLTVARTATDALLGSDAATEALAVSRTGTDLLLSTDGAARSLQTARTAADALLSTDAATGTSTGTRTAADDILGADAATRALVVARTADDALLGADTATRDQASSRTADDALLAGDTATRSIVLTRSTTDALLGADTAASGSTGNRTATDQLLTTDNTAGFINSIRSAADALLGNDTAFRLVLHLLRTATDALLGSDTAVGVLIPVSSPDLNPLVLGPVRERAFALAREAGFTPTAEHSRLAAREDARLRLVRDPGPERAEE